MKKNATCPFCSLHCSDLWLSIENDRLIEFSPNCSLGEEALRQALINRTSLGQDSMQSNHESVIAARGMLQDSRQPLIVLSGQLDNAAVTSAVRLAEKYSATLVCDENWSGFMLASGIQTAGHLTKTLDEIEQRSLVINLGIDLWRTVPRFDDWVHEDSETVIMDPYATNHLEVLRWLRLASVGTVENLPNNIIEITDRIAKASSGYVIFGSSFLSKGQVYVTELMLWLRDLNRHQRWFAVYLPPEPNTIGVVNTITSETGYPGNLHFNAARAEFSPRRWQVDQVIRQGDFDLCLLLGHPIMFSEETLSELQFTPTILIDPFQPRWKPHLWINVAIFGVDADGWVHRFDGVPVELRPIVSAQYPPMEKILLDLCSEVNP